MSPQLPQLLQDFVRTWRCLLPAAVLLWAGCQSILPGRLEPSPLSVSQQQKEILELVPPGTSYPEAMRILKSAGIECTPGSNESICYCDIWNRQGGARWYLNVALLFDADGQLYAARDSQATTELETSGVAWPPGASGIARGL